MTKTPLRELLDWESNLSQMFDSDHRIAMALLEKIRTERKEMLEKEDQLFNQVEMNRMPEEEEEIYNLIRNAFHSQSGYFLNKKESYEVMLKIIELLKRR